MEIKKVKSFTLSEMLVVLLLTVIVVGLAFSVLNLVQKQMYITQANYQVNTELDVLRQALWLDFRSHSQAFYNDERQQLTFSNELHGVNYRFQGEYVIREKDTFSINLTGNNWYFLGEQVSNGKIDAVEINTSKTSGGRMLFVYRQNDAANHMN